MELPGELKALYRHWPLHTAPSRQPHASGVPREILSFVEERVKIWQRKTAKESPPFTADPVLARYRFCNILRELDRQTIEFHTLLEDLRGDFPLWLLNMFCCRMIARPETVRAVGLLSFDKAENERWYKKLMESERPRFGTPYVFPVSVIQGGATPTRELFLARHLPDVIGAVANEVRTWDRKSVYDGVRAVLPVFRYPLSFLWTEVLIDTAYQFPERLDLFSRFPVGPGALPTFERFNPGEDPSRVVQALGALGVTIDISYNNLPIRLSAENWEGVGCEYRKYTNLKQGKGRKRIYATGSAPSLF